MPRFCPDCGSQLRGDVKFCDKCGAQIQPATSSQNSGAANYMNYKAAEKSMATAMLISFFITGLGIAYAGNTEKGLIFFAVSFVTNLICLFLFIPILFFIVAFVLWAVGLYLTYNEVNEVNNRNKMIFMLNN